MKLTMTIDSHSIETEIGDGVIRMSWMDHQQLADHLLNEVFRVVWPEPARKQLAIRIAEIRQTAPDGEAA